MADKLVYTGGTVANKLTNLTTSFADQVGYFPDSSVTGFGSYNDSTGLWTAPSDTSGFDAVIIEWSIEYEDSSNGRVNPSSQFVQKSGSATQFRSTIVDGFSRDNSEDRAFNHGMAIGVGISNSSTFQLQAMRDSDGGTGGTVTTSLTVFPINYGAIGIYSSASSAAYATRSVSQVTGWSTLYESDAGQINRNGDGIDLLGDNKRYQHIMNYSRTGGGGSRTALIMQPHADATPQCVGYTYIRNSANDSNNSCFTQDIIETSTATIDLDMRVGPGPTPANDIGGSEFVPSSPSSGTHTIIVIEHLDQTNCFRSHDSTGGQELDVTGPVDLNVFRDIDFVDSGSYASSSNTGLNAEAAHDAWVGANVWAPSDDISAIQRNTSRAHITVNGTEAATTMDGHYLRNDQSTSGTFDVAYNPSGVLTLALNDDIGVSVQEISGTESGPSTTRPGGSDEGVTIWGVDLDSMFAAAGTEISASTDSLSLTENAATIAVDVNVNASTDTLSLSTHNATVGVVSDVEISAGVDELTLTESAATIAVDVNVLASSDDLTLSEFAATIANDVSISASVDAITLSEFAASVANDVNVLAGVDELTLTEAAATVSVDVNVLASTDDLSVTEHQASVANDVAIAASTNALTLTEFQATVETESNTEINASVDELVLTELRASVSVDINIAATVDELSLTTNKALIYYAPPGSGGQVLLRIHSLGRAGLQGSF